MFKSKVDDMSTDEDKIHGGYLNCVNIHPDIIKLFNEATLVIYNSFFTQNEYLRYFSKHNVIVEYPNDIPIDYTTTRVPLINNTINISHFQGFSIYKGKEIVKLLMDKYYSPKFESFIKSLIVDYINKHLLNGKSTKHRISAIELS